MEDATRADEDLDAQVDAAMAAARVFVAVIAESMRDIDSAVSPVQFRTLVIVGARGPLNVSSLADLLSVHPSNATRVCERLVQGGLLARTQSDLDRRQLQLTLTGPGRKLVAGVMHRRRSAFTRVLSGMSSAERVQLTVALRAFGEAAGETVETDVSPYGLSVPVR